MQILYCTATSYVHIEQTFVNNNFNLSSFS